tara:strand:- start:1725 stop:2468 length:744 start_codon:yes stop_codon:yes gene_type:complete
MKKNYWIRKKGKKGKIIWRSGRSQGLEGAKGRIGNVSKQVKDILRKRDKIKVLEVGSGFGRALLELKRLFGNRVEVYGTNFESEWNQKLAKEYALDQGFSKNEIPKIYNNIDASKKLPFRSSSFDFVFCQATMQYILDRALFLEEVNRILTKEGVALLELQEFRDDHPIEYKNLFEIWEGKKRIDVLDYLRKFNNIKIKKSKGRDWHYIVMKKSKRFKLNLELVHYINLEEDICSDWWGSKLIYKLK